MWQSAALPNRAEHDFATPKVFADIQQIITREAMAVKLLRRSDSKRKYERSISMINLTRLDSLLIWFKMMTWFDLFSIHLTWFDLIWFDLFSVDWT